MKDAYIIQMCFEFIIGTFIIWGFFNESKFVDFEEKIISKFKNSFKK